MTDEGGDKQGGKVTPAQALWETDAMEEGNECQVTTGAAGDVIAAGE